MGELLESIVLRVGLLPEQALYLSLIALELVMTTSNLRRLVIVQSKFHLSSHHLLLPLAMAVLFVLIIELTMIIPEIQFLGVCSMQIMLLSILDLYLGARTALPL